MKKLSLLLVSLVFSVQVYAKNVEASLNVHEKIMLKLKKDLGEMKNKYNTLEYNYNSLKIRVNNLESKKSNSHITKVIKPIKKLTLNMMQKKRVINTQKGDFVVTYVWKANIRHSAKMESRIIRHIDIATILDIDSNFNNKWWYKLTDGGYISKNVTRTLNNTQLKEMIVKVPQANIRTYPTLKESTVKEIVYKNDTILIYPKLIADGWFLTNDLDFIYPLSIRKK